MFYFISFQNAHIAIALQKRFFQYVKVFFFQIKFLHVHTNTRNMSKQLSSIKKQKLYTKGLIEILCHYGNNYRLKGQDKNKHKMKNHNNASHRYK